MNRKSYKLYWMLTLVMTKAVNFSRPSWGLQNSQIWPIDANSCILLQNSTYLTTFIHLCLNNSIDYKIQHRNVHHSLVWGGHSGQERIACLLVNHWWTKTNYTHLAEFWLAAMTRFPKLLNTALICLSLPLNSITAKQSFSFCSDIVIVLTA